MENEGYVKNENVVTKFGSKTKGATKDTKPALLWARMNQTLYIYDEETKADVEKTLFAKARKTGHAINFPDKSIWYDYEAIVDKTKHGADMFIWAKDGNRVKCHLIQKTLTNVGDDDVLTTKIVGACYREW